MNRNTILNQMQPDSDYELITLGVSQNLQAQQRGQQGPPPMPDDEQIEKMVEDLSEELSLTEDQEKQVSKKYFAHFDEVEAKIEAGKPDRKEMETLKSDFEKDIEALLTDEQKEKYIDYLKKESTKTEEIIGRTLVQEKSFIMNNV